MLSTNSEVTTGAINASNMADEKHYKKESTEMNMSKIKDIFKENFMDEMCDSNEYFDMAHAAEDMGHTNLAKGLYSMAYDEFTHAKFIHDNLVDWGCELSEKETIKWHELKERIQRKFRR